MGHSLPQHAQPARAITADDRMELLGQLTPRQQTDALLWLAGYAPDIFDAVTDAVQPFCSDGSNDPAPFCQRCGADIGVFLKLGLDWHHYRATTLRDIELFDPGHTPILAWRIHAPAAT